MSAGSQRVQTIEGRALPMRGDDIDTDRIIPARHLRAVSFEGLERFVFEDDRAALFTGGHSSAHPFDDPRFAGAQVLVVQRNFGCGSSREHAPQALQRWGIRAIVGESFSDIFFGNALMIGLPCVSAARPDVAALLDLVESDPRRRLRISLDSLECSTDGFTCPLHMPSSARDALTSGAWDTTGMLLDRFDEVRSVAARLPYLASFTTLPRG